jgi:DNA-binding response OmpR family regulator
MCADTHALYLSNEDSVRTDGERGKRRHEILIVDDDRDLVEILAFLVGQAGLIPLVASDPESALELLEKHEPSVAVVDLNLRPFDGFELLAELRRRSDALPIIVLTSRTAEDDKVRALDLGADDYIEKPFGNRELVARIRANARRFDRDRGGVPTATLEVGPFRLDLGERTLHVDGVSVRLTGTEFRLLQYLVRNRNVIVPTDAIAKYVWGYNDPPARDVIRVTVHRLRRKLGDDGAQHRFIETVPGVGLRLLLA